MLFTENVVQWPKSSFAFSLKSSSMNRQNHLVGHVLELFKGIVHFESKIWYLSAYPKGIQDVGVFFSSVDPILMFLGQTVLICQSYNGRYMALFYCQMSRAHFCSAKIDQYNARAWISLLACGFPLLSHKTGRARSDIRCSCAERVRALKTCLSSSSSVRTQTLSCALVLLH